MNNSRTLISSLIIILLPGWLIAQTAFKNVTTEAGINHAFSDSAKGNWIKIALKGIEAESNGLGSKVEVVISGKRMIREIDGGASSHISQNSKIAHFELGNATQIDTITVYWTGGNKQIITNVKPNQLLTITEEVKEKLDYIWLYVLLALGLAALLYKLFGRNMVVRTDDE